MFLTAASSNHFKSVKQLIHSLGGAPVIFYDIGLTEIEAAEIKQLPIEYRLFDWSAVPSWGLLTAPNAGSYVWKPLIIHNVLQEDHELLIWCDAGNIVYNVKQLEAYVRSVKIYTPYSNGPLTKWTHVACLDGMGMTTVQRRNPMRNAAIIGLNPRAAIVRPFVEEWKTCALKKELSIGDRENHRWDQSILSCLFYKYNISCVLTYVGVTIHNDCD